MRQIVDVHHPHLDAALLDQVLIKFYWLREQSELRKKPRPRADRLDLALLRAGITREQIGTHPLPRRAPEEGAGRRRAPALRCQGRQLSIALERSRSALQPIGASCS